MHLEELKININDLKEINENFEVINKIKEIEKVLEPIVPNAKYKKVLIIQNLKR